MLYFLIIAAILLVLIALKLTKFIGFALIAALIVIFLAGKQIKWFKRRGADDKD